MHRKMNVCRVLYPSISPFSPRSQIRRNRANCGVFAGLGCESEKRQVLELQCRTGRRDRIAILTTLHCTSRAWGEWHTQARLERCTTQSIPVLSLSIKASPASTGSHLPLFSSLHFRYPPDIQTATPAIRYPPVYLTRTSQAPTPARNMPAYIVWLHPSVYIHLLSPS